MSDDSKGTNVVRFPRTLRVVPIEPNEAARSVPLEHAHALIEHDGRLYNLAPLIQQLPPRVLKDLDAAALRSGQALWDDVVRRWPALAAEIVAGARPIG